MENVGHLYYKEYFKGLFFKLADNNLKTNFNFNNGRIFNLGLPDNLKTPKIYNGERNNTFELITTYPGLLIGSGYNHEIGGKELKDE